MPAQHPLAADRNTIASTAGLLIATLPVAAVVGSAVAFFLWSLDAVTRFRFAHGWLLWLLPAAGAVIGLVYSRWGHTSDAGTRLIIDEIHEPGGGIPSRMAPLVLVATLITHLFGGSAGREGTAVQMGGALASAFERKVLKRFLGEKFALIHAERRQLLQAGMAAGFGAVFGTPFAGAIFAIEVLRPRAGVHARAPNTWWLNARSLIPCLLAAFAGHLTVAMWGVAHTSYPSVVLASIGVSRFDALVLIKVAVAAVCFGIAARLFLESAHAVSAALQRLIPQAWLRPVVGGCVVIVLTLLVGSRDYLGLGVTAPDGGVSIVNSFAEGGAHPLSWLYKLAFTVVTVGSGFKGGEVTPLFFVGATLGNLLAGLLHAPVVLFAALGFVAVFGAAARTPLACVAMALELFGPDATLLFALACGVAFLCSGRRGLYHASATRHERKTEGPHKP